MASSGIVIKNSKKRGKIRQLITHVQRQACIFDDANHEAIVKTERRLDRLKDIRQVFSDKTKDVVNDAEAFLQNEEYFGTQEDLIHSLTNLLGELITADGDLDQSSDEDMGDSATRSSLAEVTEHTSVQEPTADAESSERLSVGTERSSEPDPARECSICLEELAVEGTTWTQCIHGFHTVCFNRMVQEGHRQCPVCRHSLLEQQLQPGVDVAPAPAQQFVDPEPFVLPPPLTTHDQPSPGGLTRQEALATLTENERYSMNGWEIIDHINNLMHPERHTHRGRGRGRGHRGRGRGRSPFHHH